MNRTLQKNSYHTRRRCVWKNFARSGLFARIVKRRIEGPSRAESGPVDDIRGQFRNCVSVEFAVDANDRKTRSADMPRGARATGALS